MRSYLKIFLVLSLVSAFFLVGKASAVRGKNPGHESGYAALKYKCGSDICDGYRCVGDVDLKKGISVSPACYNENELTASNCENGEYMLVSEIDQMCSGEQYYLVWPY